jgi:signal transduction histidine kinase
LTSLAVAVPTSAAIGYAADRLRARDLEVALERVVRSQINEQVRERCESDPTWFLTGPLEGRPKGGVFVSNDPEALPPRPKVIPQPFELFAYDDQFIGSSSASARFPPEFRQALRQRSEPVKAAHITAQGTGTQLAMPTGWIGSTCMFFLGRMEAPLNQRSVRLWTYGGLFAATFLVGLLVNAQTVGRIRRLSRATRGAIDEGYAAIAPDSMKDELSAFTFMFNDAATELHQRRTRIDDQDAALKRFVQSTDEEVGRPLAELEATLGSIVAGPSSTRDELHGALRQAHDLSHQVANLTAAARLRLIGQTPPVTQFDLNAVVTRVIARHMPIAEAGGVGLHLSLPPSTVIISGDEALIERAISNVVDNAVRYNRPGGDVRVTLALVEQDSRFGLWIVDTGRSVSDDEFRGLTAVRRFRGDEGRIRRPGAPGLGLAVTREIADRFKLHLDLKRPAQGGFEVELSGAV